MRQVRMSAEDFRRLGAKRPTQNKFNAKRIVSPTGETFDSAGEEARYAELLLRQRVGEIADLRRQTSYPLTANGRPVTIARSAERPSGRQVVYRADFDYVVVATGVHVIEDHKGYDTRESRLKRAILETMGFTVTLTGPAANRPRGRPHRG